MWSQYINVASVNEAVLILNENMEKARIISGATDLILEMERGVRKGIATLIDISRIQGLDYITLDEERWIHLGPNVTHNHCAASKLLRDYAFPLVRAAWEVGSPQIRNRGTVAGNIITASPANDTISPLVALGAKVTLASVAGTRDIQLADFYTGVRKTVMAPNEMLVDISFPAMTKNQKGTFVKFALRRAQAISLLNLSVILTFHQNRVDKAAITLGAVAPTIIHAIEAEEFLTGKELDMETIERAADLAMQAAKPISDIRSSNGYRRNMVRVTARRALKAIADGTETEGMPLNPVLLWGQDEYPLGRLPETVRVVEESPIRTRINGRDFTFNSGQDKTLLRLLREDAKMIGTKEGCAEGECGACTIYLDGVAVMACMVPAPRADGADIVTIEGVSQNGELHPVQQAFIDAGAVQCGYCTPGFVMSAVKLLEERNQPTPDEIRQAITGNLCRCTGYYKIVEAIEKAAEK